MDRFNIAVSRMRKDSLMQRVAMIYFNNRGGVKTADIANYLGVTVAAVSSTRQALSNIYGFEIERMPGKLYKLNAVTLKPSARYLADTDKLNKKRMAERRARGCRTRSCQVKEAPYQQNEKDLKEAIRAQLIRSVF